MKIAFVYFLKSLNFDKTYTGITFDLEKRLSEHNSGCNSYTRKFKPWKLIYFEKFSLKKDAMAREKYFKSHAGRKYIKKKLFDI